MKTAKWICITLFSVCFCILPKLAWADDDVNLFYIDENKTYDYKLWERNGKFEQKVMEVGFRLLNANKIKNRVAFSVYDKKNMINAFAFWPSSQIIVLTQIFPYIDDDDELSALLAHEIGHIQQYDSTKTFFIKLIDFPDFTSKHYEYDADTKGIDLMVNAGYNPLAMITFLNKISGEDNRFIGKLRSLLWLQTHPTGSKRLQNIYNYILVNYPQFIANGYNSPYYENFLMNAEQNQDLKKIKDKHDL